jgi:tRNA modification GTPase
VTDTIFALSSGAPPAAIGVIRLSGPAAAFALEALAGHLPPARQASLRTLRGADGTILDEALILWFPGPASATGEDCAELHCHGGRAVVAAVRAALAAIDGLREAEPGEFTRRAFENGRIDLAQAEALGDLLAAETELQRRVAQAGAGGVLSARIGEWRTESLALSAMIEAVLDFAEDDGIHRPHDEFWERKAALREAIVEQLKMPRGERLRDGVRVVLAGPPNAGKSSLFNRLVGHDAAIVTPTPGTTRDVIERSVALRGVPFVFVDTAGLREDHDEDIEAEGIARARTQVENADIVLWLGPEHEGPAGAIEIQSRCDDPEAPVKEAPVAKVSSETGFGIQKLVALLVDRATSLLPKPGMIAVNARHAAFLEEAAERLSHNHEDILLMAEDLRAVRVAFDRLLGHSGVEEMLDTLFGRFCIGK